MPEPDDAELKRMKEIERFKWRLTGSVELLRATSAFEHAALRPPFFLNGGAAVVFVAFLGAVSASSEARFLPDWTLGIWAVVAWIVGLVFSSTATALGYYSQLAFRKATNRALAEDKARDDGNQDKASKEAQERGKQNHKGYANRRLAELLWAGSLLAFVVGIVLALWAIKPTP